MSVAEQLKFRYSTIRRGNTSYLRIVYGLSQLLDVGGMGIEISCYWNFFLQQKQRRLKAKLGNEAFLHRLVEQGIGKRQKAHALVMRHIRTDDGMVVAARQPTGGIVDGFKEAVSPLKSGFGHGLKIGAGLLRKDHQCKHRGIRSEEH